MTRRPSLSGSSTGHWGTRPGDRPLYVPPVDAYLGKICKEEAVKAIKETPYDCRGRFRNDAGLTAMRALFVKLMTGTSSIIRVEEAFTFAYISPDAPDRKGIKLEDYLREVAVAEGERVRRIGGLLGVPALRVCRVVVEQRNGVLAVVSDRISPNNT